MKPVIGIFPSYSDEKNYIYLKNLYFDEVMNSGGIPVIIPVTDDANVISETLKHIDGLILSGLGIAYTGSSRPASETEHMVGQTWEVMDVEKGKVPNLHGIEVGEGTFAAIVMYKKLYNSTEDVEIKALIEKYIDSFDKILALQKLIKIPFTVTEKDKFIDGILRGRTFRVRYTLLQYLYDRGELEEYAEYAYTETMKYK